MSERVARFELLLQGPFVKELGNCWTFNLDSCPEEWHSILLDQSDTQNDPKSSQLKLFEDSVELGPGHSPHSAIREVGGGAFSHWKGGLYFSSSDNSNPNENFRKYRLVGHNLLRDNDKYYEAQFSREVYAFIQDQYALHGDELYQWYRRQFLPRKVGLSPWDIAIANFVQRLNGKFKKFVEVGAGFGQASMLIASRGMPTLAIDTNQIIFNQMAELLTRIRQNIAPDIDRYFSTRIDFFPTHANEYLSKDSIFCAIDLSFGMTDEQEADIFRALPLAGGVIIGLRYFFKSRGLTEQAELVDRIVGLGFAPPIDLFNSFESGNPAGFPDNRVVYFENLNVDK